MNYKRLFICFIIFSLLIATTSVAFASDDVDNIVDDESDIILDDDLDDFIDDSDDFDDDLDDFIDDSDEFEDSDDFVDDSDDFEDEFEEESENLTDENIYNLTDEEIKEKLIEIISKISQNPDNIDYQGDLSSLNFNQNRFKDLFENDKSYEDFIKSINVYPGTVIIQERTSDPCITPQIQYDQTIIDEIINRSKNNLIKELLKNLTGQSETELTDNNTADNSAEDVENNISEDTSAEDVENNISEDLPSYVQKIIPEDVPSDVQKIIPIPQSKTYNPDVLSDIAEAPVESVNPVSDSNKDSQASEVDSSIVKSVSKSNVFKTAVNVLNHMADKNTSANSTDKADNNVKDVSAAKSTDNSNTGIIAGILVVLIIAIFVAYKKLN